MADLSSITVGGTSYNIKAKTLEGIYTANGGQQGPGYFGKNKVGALMSNATVNGDNHYKNWLYMDNYSGTDVGGATAIGLDRLEARAFIMQSDANRTAWNNSAELYSTAHKPTLSELGAAASSHSHSYLPLSGGTMTGVLTAKGSMYEDAYNGALNMNNSDIYNLNSIYTADTSDGAAEGIHFYRDSTHVDTLWMNSGNLYFVPNRALGTNTTAANSYKIYHTGFKPTYSDVGAAASSHTHSYLPLSGGTMTGQILTSFKSSVAMGSYGASASTIPNLVEEVRYSSGCAGSFSLGTAYTKDGITIGTGWYNFMYMPHRSGGVNGAASGDNHSYGSLLLSGMTVSGCYIIRISSNSIAELRNLYADTNTWRPIGTGASDAAAGNHTHNYAGSSSAGGDATNALKLNGYASDTAASNNTIARRQGNGYLFATYFNQSSGEETPTTSSYIIYANSDGYLRKSSLANVKSILGLGSAAYTASTAYAASTHSHNYITRGPWWNSTDTSKNANDLTDGVVFAYSGKHNSATTGTLLAVSSTSNTYQLQIQGNYSGNTLHFRNKNGDNSTWGAWKQVQEKASVSGTKLVLP